MTKPKFIKEPIIQNSKLIPFNNKTNSNDVDAQDLGPGYVVCDPTIPDATLGGGHWP